jgi:hypothetical protein
MSNKKESFDDNSYKSDTEDDRYSSSQKEYEYYEQA